MKERKKKEKEEKRDEVLPGSRATYGALAALACLLRDRVGPSLPSSVPPVSFSLPFSLSLSPPLLVPSAFSLDGESFVPRCELAALNSPVNPSDFTSAAEKVQRCVRG